MSSKIKIGIIGCSRIARRSVIPAIIKSEFAELEIIGSRTEQSGREFSREFSCKKFGGYNEVFSDESVDAVYISTPIGAHEEWAIKAAKSGKHIYCEKSSTTSYKSAKKILNCCKENKVRIIEGFMFRFHPQHFKVKQLIRDDEIGEIISFNGNFGFPTFPEGDTRYNKQLGGGFLNDAGCYPICASRMIFGEEPIGVSCDLSIDKKTGVDFRGTSFMKYKNEKTASISYGNGNYYQAKYDVWGSKGIISLERAYSVPPDFMTKINVQYKTENGVNNKKNHWDSRKNKCYDIKPEDHFLNMINEFCLEITNERKSMINFEVELLCQARVMEAHRLSADKKRFVNIDEID